MKTEEERLEAWRHNMSEEEERLEAWRHKKARLWLNVAACLGDRLALCWHIPK